MPRDQGQAAEKNVIRGGGACVKSPREVLECDPILERLQARPGTGRTSRPVVCISCAICSDKIPLSSIRSDAEAHHPRFGQHRPGQQTISCPGCGRLLHTRCVDEAGTTIGGHHLWFSNMRMRAFLQEHGLVGHQVAFCKDCHEELGEQILDNYKMMERFDEGARFLEEFGRVDEAFALLAEIKG